MLRRFFLAAGFFLCELAAYAGYLLLDSLIATSLPVEFQRAASIALISALVFLPFAILAVSHWLIKPWRRSRNLKGALAAMSHTASVEVMGRTGRSSFKPDVLVRLIVPDAIVAIDKTRRLLRLKAIDSAQDGTIDIGHIIGLAFSPGENRQARAPQARFRHYNPPFRTLAELPHLGLEIASKGREPVLEYELFAAPEDRKVLERFAKMLDHLTWAPRYSQLAATTRILDALPVQGARHDYA